MKKTPEPAAFHAGFAAIVGAPNAGKSTFLNQVLGFKLAITSDKPQTTRQRLLGIHNQPGMQICFLDTPGLHQPQSRLHKLMVNDALAALKEVDALLFMVEGTVPGLKAAKAVADMIKGFPKPPVVGLNKIDLIKRKTDILPFLAEINEWDQWSALVPMCARTGEGSPEALNELACLLPQGGPIFPEETLTDLSERFLAAEIVREKVFRLTEKEVPYSTAVTIDEFLEPIEPGSLFDISATIHVERSGQKAIIIGKGGAMLKKIGEQARKDMERLLAGKVFLRLFVRVEPKWTHENKGLRKLGY